MSTLWQKYNFLSPINCLIDVPITVFDIRKANISVLREKGVITQSDYDSLYFSNKMYREVFIGKLIGNNPEVSNILAEGIIEAKRLFFEANNIEDREVLEINNDAVYLIGGRRIQVQQVSPLVYFNLADNYTSFYNVKNIRFYYYCNRIQKVENLTPKGMSKSVIYHEQYMLDFLKALFYTAQFEGIQKALELLSTFYSQYISRSLNIGYYRNLNSSSRYSIVSFDQYADYQTDIITANMINLVDISYNEKVLREFNKLLTEKYFNRYR